MIPRRDRRVGVDTGGTFTDLVLVAPGGLRVVKCLSTPRDPARAVLSALAEGEVPAGRQVTVVHGTTVATNTLLTRTGARTALVTTAGFEDVLALGRQARPALYDLFQTAPDPLVPAALRFGIRTRTRADGRLETPPGAADIRRLVAVQRLLHHTAGLGMQWNFYYDSKPYRRPSMEESIRRFGVCVYPPGETYNYANFGYGIIDYIIERVTQKTYPEFMRAEVFEPLGLAHTDVLIAPGPEEIVAVRYRTEKDPLPFYDFDHRGASAVYSSAHDLVRFGMFHLKNHLSGQKPILSDKTIDLMQETVDPNLPKSSYKLGWSVNDTFGFKTVSHGGGMPGVTTNLIILPQENIAAAVLCNKQGINLGGIIHSILSSLLPEYAKEWEDSQKKNKERQAENFSSPPALIGYWTGEIKTYADTFPVQMIIEEKGKIWFKITGEKYRHEEGVSTLEPPRFMDDHLIASFNIKILEEESKRSAAFLLLNLIPQNRNTVLAGYAATQAYDSEFCLPSYIRLTKKPQD